MNKSEIISKDFKADGGVDIDETKKLYRKEYIKWCKMIIAACIENEDYEKAAIYRDEIAEIKKDYKEATEEYNLIFNR